MVTYNPAPYVSIGWMKHHHLRPCMVCVRVRGNDGLPVIYPATDGYNSHVECNQCRSQGTFSPNEENARIMWNKKQEKARRRYGT